MRKLLLPWLSVLIFTACQKQVNKEIATQENGVAAAGKNTGKIDVCHKEGNGSWHTINISNNALPAHLAHGDIVPDADGDGYTKVNPCGNGNQDDCDDSNAAIHPGATEICGNNLDDNCNGQVDENCIPSVTICSQTWMLKNLDVTTYRNGDPIPEVTDNTAWSTLTTGAWCYYGNSAANGTVYGKLYNWFAVNDPRGLAPAGWHIPSLDEWNTLSACLGGDAVSGFALKSSSGWVFNGNGSNSSGFTGLPGARRTSNGAFSSAIGFSAYWWTSTESTVFPTAAWNRFLTYSSNVLGDNNIVFVKGGGQSVRCIKD